MISERLKKIVDYKGVTPNAFSKLIGVSSQRFGKYIKDREPDAETLKLIVETFDDININWLLTGKGEMLKEKPSCQPTSTTSDENILINKLLDMITKQQETIERQQKSIEDLTALLSKQIVVDKGTEAEAAKCAIAG